MLSGKGFLMPQIRKDKYSDIKLYPQIMQYSFQKAEPNYTPSLLNVGYT